MDLVSRITEVITAIGVAIKGKQDNLVSGTNIKTINSQSLLGSGNIVISGGGGGVFRMFTFKKLSLPWLLEKSIMD